MNYTAPKQTELTITRAIPARPDEVYDVWLDTKSPGGPWFGAKRVLMDAKVDGLFYHCVDYEGHEWAHYGRFVALDRARRIEHTWMSEATRGLESIVSVAFEADGKGSWSRCATPGSRTTSSGGRTARAGRSYWARLRRGSPSASAKKLRISGAFDRSLPKDKNHRATDDRRRARRCT